MNPLFIVYGRMNPPTIGHKALIDRMLSMAEAVGGDAVILVSHSQDDKKNPLTPDEKIGILRKIYPDEEVVDIVATSSEKPFIGTVLKEFEGAGYGDITLVLGSDRVADFQFLKRTFPHLKIVSGGERDPDADDDVAGMSATKMREAAVAGNWNTFRAGINGAVNNATARKTMANIKSRLAVAVAKKGATKRKRMSEENVLPGSGAAGAGTRKRMRGGLKRRRGCRSRGQTRRKH